MKNIWQMKKYMYTHVRHTVCTHALSICSEVCGSHAVKLTGSEKFCPYCAGNMSAGPLRRHLTDDAVKENSTHSI